MSFIDPKENMYQRKALRLSGFQLAAMSFSTLGIIYSDIGTSPLYVLNGIWPPNGDVPSEEDVIGGISAIVWSLTLVPLLKYVIFALEFGTGAGEGGPFALYMDLFPRREPSQDGRSLTTYTTNDGQSFTRRETDRLGYLARFKWPLLVWTLFGTALTLADGVLTPAVSVTSAVGGIAVAQSSVANSVVGISIAFLVVLFLIQPFGTQRISFVFAPITLIWLLLLGCTGIYNITMFPGIWRAYDPSRAVMWFVRTGNYDYLAGVLLCVTGCEAMFANLGQFNKTSIRIAFTGLVYPMLILAYLGQGAALINDPTILDNIFYLSIPGPTGGGLYWIVFVFAVLATFIASQAMITGTFSIVQQLIGMHAFPAVRVSHTSKTTAGQIYVGFVNWLLAIGCIAVVGGFGSSYSLTLAYGFAVATVMIVTTSLIALSIPFVKHLSFVFGLAFILFFGFIDGLFWGASLKKVPLGAWFPLGLGSILCGLMVFWSWGRGLEDSFNDAHHQKLTDFIIRNLDIRNKPPTTIRISPVVKTIPMPDDEEEGHQLTSILREVVAHNDVSEETIHPETAENAWYFKKTDGDLLKLARIPVMSIFYKNDSAGQGVPHAFASFLQRYPALPQVVVFLSTRIVAVPHVELEDRYVVTKVRSIHGFYGVTMRVGYLDHSLAEIPELVSRIISLESRYDHPESVEDLANRIREIEAAGRNATRVIPSYSLLSRPMKYKTASWIRRLLVEEIYGRARVIFPDRVERGDRHENDTIHVAVNAII